MPMYTVQANCVVNKVFYVMAKDEDSALRKAEKGQIYHEVEEDMAQYELGSVWETDADVAGQVNYHRHVLEIAKKGQSAFARLFGSAEVS